MFLRANVQGVNIILLVVKGATLTLVSNEVVRRIGKELMPHLYPMCKSLYDAGVSTSTCLETGRFLEN